MKENPQAPNTVKGKMFSTMINGRQLTCTLCQNSSSMLALTFSVFDTKIPIPAFYSYELTTESCKAKINKDITHFYHYMREEGSKRINFHDGYLSIFTSKNEMLFGTQMEEYLKQTDEQRCTRRTKLIYSKLSFEDTLKKKVDQLLPQKHVGFNQISIGGQFQSKPNPAKRKTQEHMVALKAPHQYPFTAIGMVACVFEKISAEKKKESKESPYKSTQAELTFNVGTAALISKNYGVSCAHNFASPALNGYQLITAVLILTDRGGEKHQFKIKECFISKEFKEEKEKEKLDLNTILPFDFSLFSLELSHQQKKIIQKKFGYLGIAFGQKSMNKQLSLYGFPQDYNDHFKDNHGQHQLYGNSNAKNGFFTDRLIKYNIGTDLGMSGGPIFMGGVKEPYIVGVHGFNHNKSILVENVGVYFSNEIRKIFNHWLSNLASEKIEFSAGKHLDKSEPKQESVDLQQIKKTMNLTKREGTKFKPQSNINSKLFKYQVDPKGNENQYFIIKQNIITLNRAVNEISLYFDSLHVYGNKAVPKFGIHRFKFKLLKCKKTLHLGFILQSKRNTFEIEEQEGAMIFDCHESYIKINDSDRIYSDIKMKEGSILSIVLDCEQRKVSFAIDETEVCKEQIPSTFLHSSFYPYISMRQTGDSVQVIQE